MKFIVLSFKIKGWPNIMKTRSGRSQGSFFHGFVTALEGMEELLDDIVASLLEVGFSMDWAQVRHQSPGFPPEPASQWASPDLQVCLLQCFSVGATEKPII